MIFVHPIELKAFFDMLKKLTIYVKLKAYNCKVNFAGKYNSYGG